MSNLRRTPHAVYNIQYHIVWIPKYRKEVLTGVTKTGEVWATGYFVSTVNDKTTTSIIKKYIEYQKVNERQLKLF